MDEKVFNSYVKLHRMTSSDISNISDVNSTHEISVVKTDMMDCNNCKSLPEDLVKQLYKAILLNNISEVEDLLKQGVDVNALIEKATGHSALMVACAYGREDIVALLLKKGAFVNEKTQYGDTALSLSLRAESADTTSLLLSHGADPNIASSEGFTPLHFACYRGLVEKVSLLLDMGAQVDATDQSGQTPLMLACKREYNPNCTSNQMIIVYLLIKKGASVNAQDNSGCSALHLAAIDQYFLIDLLWTAGGDVNIRDKKGETPLVYATRNKRESAAVLLLECGVKIDVRDSEGCTFFDKYNMLENLEGVRDFILKHIVKLKLAKLPVNIDISAEYETHWYKDFKVKCLEELKDIVGTKFKDFSLYNVFLNHNEPYYFRNKELSLSLEEYLFSSETTRKFRLYNRFLRRVFKSSKIRYELLEQAAEPFWRQDWCQRLPYNVVLKIMSYLSNDDLNSLIAIAEK